MSLDNVCRSSRQASDHSSCTSIFLLTCTQPLPLLRFSGLQIFLKQRPTTLRDDSHQLTGYSQVINKRSVLGITSGAHSSHSRSFHTRETRTEISQKNNATLCWGAMNRKAQNNRPASFFVFFAFHVCVRLSSSVPK